MSKSEVRARILADRRARTPEDRDHAAVAIAAHLLGSTLLTGVGRVACHLSMASEPGTGPLIRELLARGVEVIVPITIPPARLEWMLFDPHGATTTSYIGVTEPLGDHLEGDALATADLVVVPALAVDHAGHRLGRGAGYYDRALAHVDRPIVAVVFADELLEDVPHEEHDVAVDAVITERGLFRVLR